MGSVEPSDAVTSRRRSERGRKRRRDQQWNPPSQRGDTPAGWELRHSPYTAEGRVEGAYRFALGARNQTGWKRRMLIGLGLLFPVGIGLALLVELATALIRWAR